MRALHTPIRRQRLIDSLLGALVAVLLLALYPSTALAASEEAPVNPAVLAKAVDQMEQLDRMRISLASTLEGSSNSGRREGSFSLPPLCSPRDLYLITLFGLIIKWATATTTDDGYGYSTDTPFQDLNGRSDIYQLLGVS